MRMRVPAYLVTYFAAALPARPRRKFEPVLTNLRPRRGGASQGSRWRQARALKKVETDTELRAYFLTRRVHPCIRYHRPFLYHKLYTTYFNIFQFSDTYLRIALGPRWVDAWEPRAAGAPLARHWHPQVILSQMTYVHSPRPDSLSLYSLMHCLKKAFNLKRKKVCITLTFK